MNKHPNSLILSARHGDSQMWYQAGNAIETIEVDLKKFEIIQVHGLQNNDSEYHDRIIEMVKENMQTIRDYASGKYEKKNKLAVAV
jgi:hypothetical protein